jgi:uncharacterized phage-like protein YoqJ
VSNQKPLVVCLTGHRHIPAQHALLLPSLLEQHMLSLIDRGAVEFRAGGAVGFDMVATLKLLEIKERLPHIRLRLCLPCRDQTKGWDEAGRRAYDYILARADEVSYTVDTYTPNCMLARDRQLVEGSDICLAYCTKNKGGAFYTCSYALKNDLELINLADELPRI